MTYYRGQLNRTFVDLMELVDEIQKELDEIAIKMNAESLKPKPNKILLNDLEASMIAYRSLSDQLQMRCRYLCLS